MGEQMIRHWITALRIARRDYVQRPEGDFDSKGRWYPSEREDMGGDVRCVRSPSVAWPYSYLLRARTKAHCKTLVLAALAGVSVPDGVWDVCPARAEFVPGTHPGIVRDWVLEGCPARM